jgi:aspartyl-tRNA(Asn)/glutamyl-tRNA(Gln) amidotransferase subunit B
VMNETSGTFGDIPVTARQLAGIISLVDEGKLNFSVAASRLLPALIGEENKEPLELATQLNLIQVSNSSEIESWVMQALAKMPDKVQEYRRGKKGLIGLFVGEVKKLSKGKADPKLTTQLLEEKLKTTIE